MYEINQTMWLNGKLLPMCVTVWDGGSNETINLLAGITSSKSTVTPASINVLRIGPLESRKI